MQSVRLTYARWLIFFGVLFMWHCCTEANNNWRPRNRNQNRGLNPELQTAFQDAQANENAPWESRTPDLPAQEEIECYIEVKYTRTVNGRCLRLGGQAQPAACQSGQYLDYMNNNCEDIIQEREAREAPNLPEGGQQPRHNEVYCR